jgi:hypothetical protein
MVWGYGGFDPAASARFLVYDLSWSVNWMAK